jgi:hypothetical protein
MYERREKEERQNQRKKLLLVCFLSLVLAFLLVQNFPGTDGSPAHEQVEKVQPVSVTAPGATTALALGWKKPDPIPESVPDPMHFTIPERPESRTGGANSPGGTPGRSEGTMPTREEIELSGIVLSRVRTKSVVIIDGVHYHEGDGIDSPYVFNGESVRGAVITRIDGDRIELRMNGKKLIIHVRKDDSRSK